MLNADLKEFKALAYCVCLTWLKFVYFVVVVSSRAPGRVDSANDEYDKDYLPTYLPSSTHACFVFMNFPFSCSTIFRIVRVNMLINRAAAKKLPVSIGI